MGEVRGQGRMEKRRGLVVLQRYYFWQESTRRSPPL